MANAQNLRILDSTPGDTPLVYTQFQYHYQNSNAQGLRNSDLFEQRMLLEREVLTILLHPTFCNTCDRIIKGPVAYTRFLSSTERSRKFDDVVYDVWSTRLSIDRNIKTILQPWDEFRPGPVFVLDCQCRQSATSGLRRFKYTMKFNEVQYRLIEYRPLPPPAPAQGPPPLMIQEAQQEALEDADQPVGENMLELPV